MRSQEQKCISGNILKSFLTNTQVLGFWLYLL
jgi:hypothetical protein